MFAGVNGSYNIRTRRCKALACLVPRRGAWHIVYDAPSHRCRHPVAGRAACQRAHQLCTLLCVRRPRQHGRQCLHALAMPRLLA
eukprot:2354750-Prymnesium_polylepis.1